MGVDIHDAELRDNEIDETLIAVAKKIGAHHTHSTRTQRNLLKSDTIILGASFYRQLTSPEITPYPKTNQPREHHAPAFTYEAVKRYMHHIDPVSYTHLTLPTN